MSNKLIKISSYFAIPAMILGVLSFSTTAIAHQNNINIPSNPPGVTLNLKGKNIGRVKTGAYLVNAIGNCNSCHVTPTNTVPPSNSVYSSGDPFKGEVATIDPIRFLGGGRKFGAAPAPVYTANSLRPDNNGNPGGLTKQQFVNVMRTGLEPDGSGKYIQVMPWPVYRNLTESDLKAIYEYLSALPKALAP